MLNSLLFQNHPRLNKFELLALAKSSKLQQDFFLRTLRRTKKEKVSNNSQLSILAPIDPHTEITGLRWDIDENAKCSYEPSQEDVISDTVVEALPSVK